MSKPLETLTPFKEINHSYPLNRYVKEWKGKGGRVIGIFDGNTPEEVLYAAGILPVWLRGPSKEISLDMSNACLYIYTCSYTRSVLEMALKGEYDFLEGVVSTSYCDGTRRLGDAWDKYVSSSPVVHYLHIPRKMNERAEAFFHENLLEFIGELEKRYEATIAEDRLKEAIRVYNETRRLFQRLYELRKRDRLPISGAEMIEVYNACNMVPRDQFNTLLRGLVEELESSERFVEGDIRLLLNGTILNNAEFVDGIERLGGLIVADSLSNGSLSYTDMVEEDSTDPLKAIASRYLRQFPAPRMSPSDLRYKRILDLIKDFRVDGVITEIVRYCAPLIYDEPRLRRRLEEQDIPTLKLDLEYNMPATGQVKTRAQVFLEMIRDKKGLKA